MLRALYSGISGLRSHQTQLDVTGNNIANVNTAGFKSSSVQFQDTLSQLTQGGSVGNDTAGGRNPAQVGLGVQVAAISTDFSQGSSQATGKATDMMISGDGFFIVSKGGQQFYTRAGAFNFDPQGRLVTADGALVQGWSAGADGQIATGGAVGPITLPVDALAPSAPTTSVTMGGNLPSDAETGTEVFRDVEIFDALGQSSTVAATFTRTAGGWDLSIDGGPAQALTFTDGELTGPITVAAGSVTFDLAGLTSYADLTTVKVTESDGRAAGTLTSYTFSADGALVGTFSNGATRTLGQIATADFTNPGGLTKAGGSLYQASPASGGAEIGVAGQGGRGALTTGYLEMSNVDLSQEFTNLIVAQRGFQANSRVITTSDEILGELVNLKR